MWDTKPSQLSREKGVSQRLGASEALGRSPGKLFSMLNITRKWSSLKGLMLFSLLTFRRKDLRCQELKKLME